MWGGATVSLTLYLRYNSDDPPIFSNSTSSTPLSTSSTSSSTSSSTLSTSTSVPTVSSHKNIPVGAIACGTAGVVALVLVGGVIFFLCRRRRRHSYPALSQNRYHTAGTPSWNLKAPSRQVSAFTLVASTPPGTPPQVSTYISLASQSTTCPP